MKAREKVLVQDVQVAIWQWPEHRVLWGKRLQQGELVSVVAETDEGALICSLGGNHYFVLWPNNVSNPDGAEDTPQLRSHPKARVG
ncbi:MAG: hypothetical protein ACE5IP_02545 [Terriglobia bacterium]